MHRGPDFTPAPTIEQEPTAGTLRSVDQRLRNTLVANSNIIADTTGKVTERAKASARDRFDRILWQLGMIESLEAEKAWSATQEGSTWDQATDQAANLTAAEAAAQLENWTQQVLGDPRPDEDLTTAVYRSHAEDLLYKLSDEATRTPA